MGGGVATSCRRGRATSAAEASLETVMRASLVDTRPDDDFRYQVASRVFYDPQGADGADDSLQNYIHAVSYGQASISGIVFPTVRPADADVTGAAMTGFHPVTATPTCWPFFRTPSGPIGTPGRGGMSTHATASRAFATVALFEDPNQTRRQSTGVWAMETLHMVTELGTSTTGRQARGVRRYGQRRRFESPVHPYEVCDGLDLGHRRRSPSIRDPDLRPARHRSPAATSTRPGYRGQGPGRSPRSTVGGRSVRTQGRLRRRHHRTKTQRPVGTARLPVGAPSASKGGALEEVHLLVHLAPYIKGANGHEAPGNGAPLTDSGMPVVHARRRRSGAVGRVARLPAATIRRFRPPWLVPRRR
jgi:hypothetical protein